MFFTNLKRIIKSGFVGFGRNAFVSLASVLVMTITLFVIGSLIFLRTTLDSTLQQLTEKVDINVYFVTDAPEHSILALKGDLERLPEVRSVEYVSREEALRLFRERHENDALVMQALEELGENPLPASLNIRADETRQYETIAMHLQASRDGEHSSNPIIDKINYFQNRVAIDRLSAIIETSEAFSLYSTLIFVVISIIITFNTVRLAIYTSREEISVMRLVGAADSYIRGPFVVAGMLSGAIAAFIALLIFYPMTYWIGPITENFFSGVNLFNFYTDNILEMILIIGGGGIILGGLSSWLAVKKYLRF
jgi:cell division transport system permease protein